MDDKSHFSRLRESKKEFIDHSRIAGAAAGNRWAEKVASYAELERLSRVSLTGDVIDSGPLAGLAADAFSVVVAMQDYDPHVSSAEVIEFFGEFPDAHFLDAFVQAAMAVLDEVNAEEVAA